MDADALCILRMNGGSAGTMAASWTVYGQESNSTCLFGTRGVMVVYNSLTAPIEVRDLNNTITAYQFEHQTRSGVVDEFIDALEHDRGSQGLRRRPDHHADHFRLHQVLGDGTHRQRQQLFRDPSAGRLSPEERSCRKTYQREPA